ncbi:hypothetical protein G7Y79_00024g055180 [Physcia stellaris]|nr:hypothetical protein G7Y79_00024g055180 [Physcia stellaris]
MRFTTARPSSVLLLTKCHRKSSTFNLTEVEEATVVEMTDKYVQRVRTATRSNSESKVYLKWAIKALMRSMHPMLDANINTESIESLQHDEVQDIENTIKKAKSHQDWLKRVSERKDLCVESSKLTHFSKVLTWFYQIKASDERIVVFSQYLRFLVHHQYILHTLAVLLTNQAIEMQDMNWMDAIFTDAQLKAAVDLLGQRNVLSRPPAVFPDMTNPMGTILSHNAADREKERLMMYDSDDVGSDAVHDLFVYFVVFKRGNKSFNLLLWLILNL